MAFGEGVSKFSENLVTNFDISFQKKHFSGQSEGRSIFFYRRFSRELTLKHTNRYYFKKKCRKVKFKNEMCCEDILCVLKLSPYIIISSAHRT
jgi:hypothetical protein